MRLWNYLRAKMMEHPSQTLREGDTSITYEELCIFAEARAASVTGRYNAILCRSELAAAMALLSCLAADRTAVPLPERYGEQTFGKFLRRCPPDRLITDLRGRLEIFNTEHFYTDGESENPPAVILFTSGSTGSPKGVMLSGRALLSNVEDISSYFPVSAKDTVLISRPLYHSSVLTGEFLTALCAGARIVFSSEPFNPIGILKTVKKQGITVLGSTPTLLSLLSRFVRGEKELPIKLLSVSGECISAGTARNIRRAFPHARVVCGYGLTEAAPRVAYLPHGLFDKNPTAAGYPLPSVELRIANKKGETLPQGKTGELLVRGESLMDGYFDDPTLTQKTIRDGWLRTGDLALIGEDGLLYVKGRRDDMIIRAGMNVYPAEIENALSADERIRDVRAYGYDSDGTQEIGLSVCGELSSVEEVMQICRSKLPAYQIPSKIEICDELERLSGGKRKRYNPSHQRKGEFN